MMWLLYARAPPPDSPYWPGRRWLAVLDAAVWPGLWMMAIAQMPGHGGLVPAVITAFAGMSALRRVRTALLANHRYRFTTWRWGRVVVWLMLFGLVLKWVLPR
jgi:hypothetical protein